MQAFPTHGFDANNLPSPDRLFDDVNYLNRETVWIVNWEIGNAEGGPPSDVLKINADHFGYLDKNRDRQWITVVRDLQMGEIFVPYDDGAPRFEDIESFSFRIVPADPALLGPPCLAPGEILESENPAMTRRVYKEVHDDGVRCRQSHLPDRGWRRHDISQLQRANYRYLMEYNPHDGTLHCRVGGTAQNSSSTRRP